MKQNKKVVSAAYYEDCVHPIRLFDVVIDAEASINLPTVF